MTGRGYPARAAAGHDGQMSLLQVGVPDVRRPARAPGLGVAEVSAAVAASGWAGVVLPHTRVLDVGCYPVVQFTGAADRVAQGLWPQPDLATVAMWESMPGGFPGAPCEPLRVVGFVAIGGVAHATGAVRSLSGLGAGMVLSRRSPSSLALLDADATGVWVATVSRSGQARCVVRGRVGPVPTARRVAITRQVEEVLFGHALRHGLVS